MMSTRSRFLERASDALIVHCGLSYLVTDCLPQLERGLAAKIIEHRGISEREFDLLCLCSWPTQTQNLIGCSGLRDLLGDERINLIPGIYREQGFGEQETCWRLDLDSKFSNTGFLLPIRDSRKWFVGLWAYRSWRDTQGFPVRLRSGERAA